ncbi:MAG: hypothetical protein LBD24_03080 [Spirochaetaceae bacterium]|jgi:hypothetical protein|nr:hypothetical protein [Spirochaetaceae bacterium]
MPIPLPALAPKKETREKKPKEKPKNETSRKPPPVIILGVSISLLLLIIAGVAVLLIRRQNSADFWDGDSFFRELAAFDALYNDRTESNPVKAETLNRALDRLDKKTLGAESRLSVLKRRRVLARQDPRFVPAYRKAAEQSARALPFSEPLAVLAAESLLMKETKETRETEETGEAVPEKNAARLREYAAALTEARLRPAALGLYLLLGDFKSPERAGAIPNKEILYTAPAPETSSRSDPALAVDLALLRVLNGDLSGASSHISGLLRNPATRNPDTIRLAAEFFYDFGNPLRAAELFSLSSDEYGMARQADALWLSGRLSGARGLWTALLAPKVSPVGDDGAASPFSVPLKARGMYNLAATSEDTASKIEGMKRFLLEADPSSYHAYGIVCYTRLLKDDESVSLLEDEPTGDFLIDLELLRRREAAWSLDKMTAETWLLVNRYPQDPRIYQWGCYFFDHQRRYDETALLITQAAQYGIDAPSLALHESLALIREGLFDEAEQRLAEIADPLWQVPANRGRIREIRQDKGAALAYYQAAADIMKENIMKESAGEAGKDRRDTDIKEAKEKRNAAKVYYSISRCFRALGEEEKSRGALEQALQFDPDYLNARLSLERQPPPPPAGGT